MEEKAFPDRQEDVFELDDIVEQGVRADEEPAPDADADDIIELTEAVGGTQPMQAHDADGQNSAEIVVLDDVLEADESLASEGAMPANYDEQDENIVELGAADIADAPLTLPGMEEEPAPEVAGALFPASPEAQETPAGSEEVPALKEPASEGEQAEAVSGADAVSDEEEREAFLSLAAEMEARLNELASRHEAAVRVFEERLAAADQRFDELNAWVEEQERRRISECSVLEERLAAAEQQNAELAARTEELERQLAERSAISLDDVAFRRGLEGMVGAMLEARLAESAVENEASAQKMPAVSTAEAEADDEGARESCMADESDAGIGDEIPAAQHDESEAVDSDAERTEDAAAELDEALSARIIEVAEQVGVLEARVAEWELRCEQEAALAASRVIREEIAALRADAARTGR